jgi:hypothetical protein
MIGIFASAAGRQPRNFYVSSSGNDSNNGTIGSPWLSINKVNSQTLIPGDAVFFNGGDTFSGNLVLSASGDSSNQIQLGSYGTGRATISAGNTGPGVRVQDAEYVTVQDLIITGGGPTNNSYAGLALYTARTDKALEGILVDNVKAQGFGHSGIRLYAEHENAGTEGVVIQNCEVTNNGRSGMELGGYYHGDYPETIELSHNNIHVHNCLTHTNPGIAAVPTLTGNGILLIGCQNALVEYCTSYGNGVNSSATAGNAAIWFYYCEDSIIQYCEAYDQSAGASPYDGGAFDIDGGCHRCIIQYCYSHDNAGFGYALFHGANNHGFTDNIIRYNISQNDAVLQPGYGALNLWGESNTQKITNSIVHNNTFYIAAGEPAVACTDVHMDGIQIKNNIFYFAQGGIVHEGPAQTSAAVNFDSNLYYAADGGAMTFKHSTGNYVGLTAYKTGSSLEANGIYSNPLLTNPGGGGDIGFGGDLTTLTAYKLLAGSPALGVGATITGAPTEDYWGNTLAGATNIGADENPALSTTYTITDSDAQTYATAHGLLTERQKLAVDEFVLSMKAASIWTKMNVIYPFIGGTAATHKWNLKNPVDSNAAFRMTFTNSPTHSSAGVQFNGTNQYSDSFFTPSTGGHTTSSGHFSFYFAKGLAGNNGGWSLYDELPGFVSYTSYELDLAHPVNGDIFWYGQDTYAPLASTGNSGFGITNRNSATHTHGWKNGSKVLNVAESCLAVPPIKMLMGVTSLHGNTLGSYFPSKTSFATIGTGLSDADCLALSNAVNHLQKKLGREVY